MMMNIAGEFLVNIYGRLKRTSLRKPVYNDPMKFLTSDGDLKAFVGRWMILC
jgi:hypothetical protein